MGRLRGFLALPDRSALRSDPAWRFPILFGALSVPVALLLVWQTADTISVAPAFAAGVLAGFLVDGERPIHSRAGFRAGLVGSIGLLPAFVGFLPSLSLGPVPWLLTPLALPIVVGIPVAAAGMAGALGGELGNRLSKAVDPSRWTATAD